MSKRPAPINAGKVSVTKLTCWVCEKPISGAKTVIEGKYHCPDCTYLHDNPDAVVPEPRKQARVRLQAERLFEPPPPIRRHIDD